MNYRHAFHAGNFCDVLKHSVLAHVLEHFKTKPKPFRMVDVHAGVGVYQLTGDEATRTGEWELGIGRLLGPNALPLRPELASFLAPYLSSVRRLNGIADAEPADHALRLYPGSPMLAAMLLRATDQLFANELHPEDSKDLMGAFRGDPRVRVFRDDAYAAVRAHLPPTSRRGVLLIDPPFEQGDEWDRIVEALRDAVGRFSTGTTLLWYPRKDLIRVARFYRDAASVVSERLLRIDFDVCDSRNADMLFGNGLLIHNPPWQLDTRLRRALPDLLQCLQIGPGAQFRVDWLRPER